MSFASIHKLSVFQTPFRTKAARFAAIAAFFALCVVLLAAFPSAAFAKEYSCPSVNINAAVQKDGSLSVSETRTFEFDGSFTAVWWNFDNMPLDDCEVNVDSVTADGLGSKAKDVPEVDFDPAWREAGGPGTLAYSVDKQENTVYVFFKVEDATVDFTLNYSINNFVMVHDDVAELYWQFIGKGWSVDSDHVTAAVQLPVPKGQAYVIGEDLRAWAHGPLDGNLSIGEDGLLSLSVPYVLAGDFAEVRSTFPVDWLTDVQPGDPNVIAGTALDSILEEEERLANQANADRLVALAMIVVFLLVTVAVIAWALFIFFRYGREYKPQFSGDYWRDVPAPGMHPAVIGRLWRWDSMSQDDFTATMMHLSHIGAIRLDAGKYVAPGATIFSKQKEVHDYYITRLPGWKEKVADNKLDKKAMHILFDKIAKGADSLWFDTIKQYGADHPEAFVNTMNEWQGQLSAETNKENFFEAKGSHYQGVMVLLAGLLLVVGVVALFWLDNFIPLIALAPSAVVLFVVSFFMQRRTREAVETHAKCEGLRNWLKDFSALDERLPTDVKVWGEMMVYAYLFGVAEQAIKALQVSMPQVVDDPDFMPMYYWYMPHAYGTGAASAANPADAFASMQQNTFDAAKAAMSAAQGNFSSGSGTGGGFSGGGSFGGGGFGGGGGGAR